MEMTWGRRKDSKPARTSSRRSSSRITRTRANDRRIVTIPRTLTMRPDTPLSRDAAWTLVTEWIQGEGLRRHALAVEAAVRGYARAFGEDEHAWGIVALLHD